MESETPANTRIFFKDKQHELKGPYTERQVQEWYRQKWFDSSFPFCFMTGDDRPNEEAEFISLDTLRSLNGIGCPFASNKSESIIKKREEMLLRLEKELADFSKKCDEVKKLEKRVEDVEKMLRKLLENATAVAAPTAARRVDKEPMTVTTQRDEKREDELRKLNEWTDYFSDFYMTYVDTLQMNDNLKAVQMHGEAIRRANLIMEREEARLMCVEKIIEKLKKKDHIPCYICRVVSFNYKQFLLHTSDSNHIAQGNAPNNKILRDIISTCIRVMGDLPSKLKAEEESFAAEIAKKYASVRLDKSRLYPKRAVIDNMVEKHKVMLGRSNSFCRRAASAPPSMQLSVVFSGWKSERIADRLMPELHKHIGSNLTFCEVCELVTGTREEYYKHMQLYKHLSIPSVSGRTSPMLMSSCFVNMAVNIKNNMSN